MPTDTTTSTTPSTTPSTTSNTPPTPTSSTTLKADADIDKTDCIVIGAGVIGLAVAERLSRTGRDVILIEKESRIGTQTSSRNSEVIHAGLYYPKNSLKAQLCRRGRDLLYAFCQEYKVDHRQTGKYIIASQADDIDRLKRIAAQAAQNGVSLNWVPGEDIQAIYPLLQCEKALFSAKSGIVDSHQLMLALLGSFEKNGGTLALNTRVQSINNIHSNFVVEFLLDDGSPWHLCANEIINCAGLGAWAIARNSALAQVPERHLAKGHYFRPHKNLAFEHLIYPVPEPGGLGVHITLDLANQIKFGPDVHWIDHENYDMPTTAPPKFIKAISRYLPCIHDMELIPDYCGIRPKCHPTSNDFAFQKLQTAQNRSMINCFGIESPGLTACLAIAEHVEGLLG